MSPKVSVILSSYNHAEYIAESIHSVLNQTFTDFELLIVDDGSTDNSREIIKTFSDKRIKFFLHEVNRGPRIILTEAVNNAQGEYIAIHHSDDSWTADKLEKQVKFLDENKSYAACFTLANFIDEKSQVQNLEDGDFYKTAFNKKNRSRAEWLRYFFYNANCLCHPSLLIRRYAYEKYKLLDFYGLWQLPDYFMWIKLCFHENIYIMQEKLTNFRLRRKTQDNMSASSYDKLVRAESEFFLIAQNFLEEFKDDKFFLEVFPESNKFVVNGEFNRYFAFAQICFDKVRDSYSLIGLEILKKLLSDKQNAAQIKRLYNYDEKTFLADSGKYDIFNLSQKLSMLRTEIFLDNGENDFTLAAKKNIYVDGDGSFFGKIEIFSKQPVKFLRFDPDVNFTSIKLNSVKINDIQHKVFVSNAEEISRDFYRFMTGDPQFIFKVDNLRGKIIFEVYGKREQNYFAILNEKFYFLTDQNKNLMRENEELQKTIDTLLNSNSWKITEPLRKFSTWMRHKNKDKALSVARAFYKAIPVDEDKKVELKNTFYESLAPILKDTKRYKIWQESLNRKNFIGGQNIITNSMPHNFGDELFEQPGKIAIHAHIFYMDLLEEIAKYFSNMPYKFDALITIIDSSAVEKVLNIFGRIKNIENCIVRIVPNRGRDVAPFIIGFKDIIGKYDFIAHIHSKKSLYTGSEQTKWRQYLFDALLGNTELIRKIFKAFIDNEKLGLIYPKPAENVPYMAFTWLSNRQAGYYLLNKIQVPPNITDYFDFPAGTMFWARSSALKKFYISDLSIEDFPEEKGQNDGTIAHAFERAVSLATLAERMDFYEFNPETETYTINIGSRNLWQYYGHNESEIQWILDNGEIISFDIFDTLLMRYLAAPYLVNDLIRLKVEDLLKKNFDFPKFRLQAENHARNKFPKDVTLDEIYKSFEELTGLDTLTCRKIREIEVDTEVEISLPRIEMLNWFNKILEQGRKIWLISDMYLQTADMKRLLEKCGIAGYEKLLISCETNMRKDTAAIWNNFVAQGLTEDKLIHIGDNEMSDFQLAADRKINTYHIMSAINLFSQTPFGRMLLNRLGRKMSLYAGIMTGVILAEKFHSPFQLRNLGDGGGRLILKNFHDLGYWFFGVPLLTFMLWLIQKTAEDKIQRILFLARDGYFLQPLYKFVTKLLQVNELPNSYFYSSRRAVTVASIRDIKQAQELTDLKFEGTIKKFFNVRFGLDLSDERKVCIPDYKKDRLLVREIISDNADEILKNSAVERENYQKYIESVGGNFENVGVVDMGYSGTIQFYLQRLVGKEFIGYYFATNKKNRFGENAQKFCHGCFAENEDYGETKSSIYKYQLLFESILTAPDSQLINFDDEGKPIFGEPEPAQFQIENIREVHEGIKDFCKDILNHFGKYILKIPIDFDFVDAWVSSFVFDEKIVDKNLKKIFAFDDEYCNTFSGNALDFYLNVE